MYSYQAMSVKKKRATTIPIQRNSISRRLCKTRGSDLATQGRPREEKRLRMQMNIEDDLDGDEDSGGILRHKLPNKKQRKVTKHNLMASISKKV